MKKLKLISLIIMVAILCTGCSVEYNINITQDSIQETINVVDNITSFRTKNDILNHYNMWYPVYVNYVKEGETIEIEDFSTKANGVEYYNKSIKETPEGYNYSYKYTYDIDNYYDSYALATTFITPNVHKSSKSIILKSSKENLLCNYDYFEKVKVNITVDPRVYKLNYTNTTNINDNTYTWILDRSNCQDSQIILTLDSSNLVIEDNINENIDKDINNEDTKKDYSIYIFFAILVLSILIVSLIFNNLKKKNSKMNEDD